MIRLSCISTIMLADLKLLYRTGFPLNALLVSLLIVITSCAGDTPDPTSAALDGHVWLDGNYDGVRTPAESGVPSVTVNLIDNTGVIVTTTSTSSDGSYGFSGLGIGEYVVEFLPSGYLFTLDNQGDDDEVDSDPSPATGRTSPVTVGMETPVPSIDAGLVIVPLPTPTPTTDTTSSADATASPGPTPSPNYELIPREGIWVYRAEVGTATCVGGPSVASPTALVDVTVAEDGHSFVVGLPVPLSFSRMDDSWFATEPISTPGGSPEHPITINLAWDLVLASDVEMNGALTAHAPDCTINHIIRMEWSEGF